jgi:hypothetical protein
METTNSHACFSPSFVICMLSLYAWIYAKKYRKGTPAPLPPGPRGLPLVGNLLSLDPELHSYFAGLAHVRWFWAFLNLKS